MYDFYFDIQHTFCNCLMLPTIHDVGHRNLHEHHLHSQSFQKDMVFKVIGKIEISYNTPDDYKLSRLKHKKAVSLKVVKLI